MRITGDFPIRASAWGSVVSPPPRPTHHRLVFLGGRDAADYAGQWFWASLPLASDYSSMLRMLHVQGAEKKKTPSEISISWPKLNILARFFRGLWRRYFGIKSPNLVLKY